MRQILDQRVDARQALAQVQTVPEARRLGPAPVDPSRPTFDELASRYWRDVHFRSTEIDTAEHDWDDFRAIHGGALPMFVVGPKGIAPIDQDDTRPKDGERVGYLPAPS